MDFERPARVLFLGPKKKGGNKLLPKTIRYN
jgi:hypothetical protein